ncbi:neuraminidase-like domain-containing protein [Pseudomonas sp. NPDC089401]|uniref:Tc toxin subunit A-related protein n=1 Tax=Pseudomonas sp. NPDC089401 TaxID=3364462 RepID=UPI0037F331BA
MQQQYSDSLKAYLDKVPGSSVAALQDLSVEEWREQLGFDVDASDAFQLHDEVQHLCQQAMLEQKKSFIRHSPVLPQSLQTADEAVEGISPDTQFEERYPQYSAPGDAASMFSPAAYLTELYRHAKKLYPEDNSWHIDQRRPDLSRLLLNQQNLDTPVTALNLSNEILVARARRALTQPGAAMPSAEELLQALSTDLGSRGTPYHQHHDRLRQALLQKDPGLRQLSATPALAEHLDDTSRACLHYGISPALRALLTDEVTEEKFEQYFPGMTPETMMQPERLRSWFGLSDAELQLFMDALAPAEYQQQTLTTPLGNQMAHLTMSAPSRYINYLRLFPLPNNRWQVAFNLKVSSVVSFKLQGAFDVALTAADFAVETLLPNVEYRWAFDGERAPGTFTLNTTWLKSRSDGGGGHMHQFDVDYRLASAAAFLLKLNQVIRLHCVTGLASAASLHLIKAIAPNGITDQTLAALYRIDRLAERYAIDHGQASVMAKGLIQETAGVGERSQFDRLFNSPALVEGGFICNGARVLLHPNGAGEQADIKATLKRACRTDDQGLYELGSLISADAQDIGITLDLRQVSAIYTLSLWARHHDLTPGELRELLQLLGAPRGLGNTDTEAEVWLRLLAGVQRLTAWLAERGWTMHALQLMTRDVGGIPVSTEIGNLIGALKTAWVDAQPVGGEPEVQPVSVLAPLVASTFNLRGDASARALLRWVDRARPGELSLQQACERLVAEWPSGKPERALVDFAYGLTQMALVVHGCGVTDDALSVWVDNPNLLYAGADANGALPRDLKTLMALASFSDWHSSLADPGGTGGALLQALSAGEGIPLARLATIAGLAETALGRAAAGARQLNDIQDATKVSTWQEIEVLLQWMALAKTYGVMPDAFSRLLELEHTWPEHRALADEFVARLTPAQAAAVQAATQQPLSAALVGVLGARENLTVESLNQQLLLDALNSEQVTTSRIAEAMAALQRFIHFTLTTPEDRDALVQAVLSRAFFKDWTRWNATYATWAAGQMLIQYPENYIDPTVRHGQTQPMNDMLQALGQAQINTDTVGDAFQGYLTAFEEVANLETISGYHDSRDPSQGKSWFIGRSRGQLQQYWWRSVDEAKRGADGVFPANAWSAWNKIELGPKVLGRLIRPVVYRGRLHLGWVECEERVVTRSKEGKPEAREWCWSFKLAWRRYDGNWSTPLDFPMEIAKAPPEKVDNLSLFLAGWPARDGLLMGIYDRTISDFSQASLGGLQIFDNLTGRALDPGAFLKQVPHWLDTASTTGMCAVFAGSDVPIAENRLVVEPGSDVPEGFGEFSVNLDEAKVTQPGQDESAYRLSIRSRLTVRARRPAIANKWVEELVIKYPELGEETQEVRSLPRSRHGAILVRKEGAEYWGYLCVSTAFVKNVMGKWFNKDTQIVHGKRPYPIADYRDFTEASTASGAACFVRYKIKDESSPLEAMNIGAKPRGGFLVTKEFSLIEALGYPGGQREESIVPRDYLRSWSRRVEANAIFCRLYGTDNRQAALVRATRAYDLSTGRVEVQFDLDALAGNMAQWGNDRNETLHRLQFEFGNGASRNYTLKVYKDADTLRTAIIGTTDSGAQYLAHRSQITRLNTLFARELTVKAVSGISEILKYDTQQMPEPSLGVLVRLTLPIYNAAHHGNGKEFKVHLGRTAGGSRTLLCEGTLSDSDKTIADMMFEPGWIFSPEESYHLEIEYRSGLNLESSGRSVMIDRKTLAIVRDSQVGPGGRPLPLHIVDSVQAFGKNATSQMDFSGANALYFWELFYYTPMMVMQRFLQEERFEQAEQWLAYVFNPSGYAAADAGVRRMWNVRPLQEDTSWNDEPLKSLDPDAVAQNDPMHYKANAFMRLLDICIGRGDAAYRKLERDTLSEAKVWYLRAQRLLGDGPWTPASRGWNAPLLGQAAVAGTRQFLPEVNRAFLGYRETLRLRLYNLRHHLTLDGQPLNLPLYATPADPKALLSAAIAAEAGGEQALGKIEEVPALRFTVLLDGARSMAAQLIQFGSNMQGILERQDATALANLLTTQGAELASNNVTLYKQTLEQLAAERVTLECSLASATSGRDHYLALYEAHISVRENAALLLKTGSSLLTVVESGFMSAASVVAGLPSIYGLANGNCKPEDRFKAVAHGFSCAARKMDLLSTCISQEEAYRRRRADWKYQYQSAERQMATVQSQLDALSVRETSAQMHLAHLQTQSAHAQAQLALHQGKFTGKAMYSWLRARLASIFYTYYDLAVSRCLMAQKALQWEKGDNITYLRTGTWNGAWAGLLCGEGLMLALGQMDMAWVKWQKRELEVSRTVSLNRLFDGKLTVDGIPSSLAEAVKHLLAGKAVDVDASLENTLLSLNADDQLSIQFGLKALNLASGFENAASRRVRSIAVSLSTPLGTSPTVQARLLASGQGLPAGCEQMSISNAERDHGLFPQLNGYPALRQGAQLLPFEGLKIGKPDDQDDQTFMTLNFAKANRDQRQLLESLSDIILNVQFTVR